VKSYRDRSEPKQTLLGLASISVRFYSQGKKKLKKLQTHSNTQEFIHNLNFNQYNILYNKFEPKTKIEKNLTPIIFFLSKTRTTKKYTCKYEITTKTNKLFKHAKLYIPKLHSRTKYKNNTLPPIFSNRFITNIFPKLNIFFFFLLHTFDLFYVIVEFIQKLPFFVYCISLLIYYMYSGTQLYIGKNQFYILLSINSHVVFSDKSVFSEVFHNTLLNFQALKHVFFVMELQRYQK
jgi:hypothetical protein